MPTEPGRPPQTRWNNRVLTLSLGAIMGAAAWIGGAPLVGLALFAWFGLVAVGVAVATARSERFRETFEADERWSVADMRAGRLAAVAMLTVLAAGFVYELARGHALDPVAALALAAGGLTYSGAQVILSRRL